jgi:hypothetical protein
VRLNDEELAFAERIGWGRAGEGLRTALEFAQTVDGCGKVATKDAGTKTP